jgi:hypothetical protein
MDYCCISGNSLDVGSRVFVSKYQTLQVIYMNSYFLCRVRCRDKACLVSTPHALSLHRMPCLYTACLVSTPHALSLHRMPCLYTVCLRFSIKISTTRGFKCI